MSTSNADVVPFGKYRDRPVTDLIADRKYVDWLLTQPWFAQRYQPVYNIIVGAGGPEPQDSPEHNAMQARYLERPTLATLARAFLPDRDALIEYAQNFRTRFATPEQLANITGNGSFSIGIGEPQFEVRGWDVLFSASVELTAPDEVVPIPESPADCACCTVTEHTAECDAAFARPSRFRQLERSEPSHCPRCRPRVHADTCLAGISGYRDLLREYRDHVALAVELKPSIADDYPTVLREVLKRRDVDKARGDWRSYTRTVVLADRLAPSTVTPEQVVAIFRSRHVDLLQTDQVATARLYPLGHITDYS